MREKRNEIIILRTTKSEKNRIYEKMFGMGIRSMMISFRFSLTGHPQPECLYPKNGSGWLLLEP